jgi:diguanylate cyclase (GGDEF)-like protein
MGMGDLNINEFLRAFLDSAAVYIYVVDRETNDILLVNNHYAEHLGVNRAYMENQKCYAFVNPDKGLCAFCPRFAEPDMSSLNGENLRMAQAFNPTLGIWGKYTAYPVTWVDGRQADIITMTDVSVEKLLLDRLEKLAYYDPVTGLPNRARLELDMTGRRSDEYCVVAFGRFSLREINDAYGRKAGDELLNAMIRWVSGLDLAETELYRVEGNAFCMVIHDAALSSAKGVAKKIERRFGDKWEVRYGNGASAFIDMGIALCVADGRIGFADADDLVSSVDLTLDIARERGDIIVYERKERE